ncbi:hypothetical protein KCH_61780 [Kitasatospora cheerisanensis KCTC 2395]|uniref:Uncharacterized protein n=1 Tax=Kitasatospora cheerisanensis KCTC 2395 TaxID=1348663 RepID=A0A066YPW1_9ACTN|nr:hypothetical protein KCH_61780 [Kitasatospora cheerisanensis KCTC 2395]
MDDCRATGRKRPNTFLRKPLLAVDRRSNDQFSPPRFPID